MSGQLITVEIDEELLLTYKKIMETVPCLESVDARNNKRNSIARQIAITAVAHYAYDREEA